VDGTLTARNNNLPVNTQSWNYRMAAGADFSAVNFREVTPLAGLGAGTGSLLLGKDAGQATPDQCGHQLSAGHNALTRLAINPTNTTATTAAHGLQPFQVIRTGTGEIEILAGRDVQLLNQFATIYTAGVTVPSVPTVFTAGDFVAAHRHSSGSTPPQTSRCRAAALPGAIQHGGRQCECECPGRHRASHA
jgi:filamentous hemagglutinin